MPEPTSQASPSPPTIDSITLTFPNAEDAPDYLSTVLTIEGSNLKDWGLMVMNKVTGAWDPIPIASLTANQMVTEQVPESQYIDGQGMFGGWYQFVIWTAGETGASFSYAINHPKCPTVGFATYDPAPWHPGDQSKIEATGTYLLNAILQVDAMDQFTEAVNDEISTTSYAFTTPGAHYVRARSRFGASGHFVMNVEEAPPAPIVPTITSVFPESGDLANPPPTLTVTGENLGGGTIIGFGPVESEDQRTVELDTTEVNDETLIGETALLPPIDQSGTAEIRVQTDAGESNMLPFTLLAAPEVPTPGYPTCAELVDESLVAALTSLPAPQQQLLYEQSIAAIEEYCGQKFDFQAATTYILDGTGSDVLYLPKRLEALTGLVVEGSTLAIGDVILQEPYDKLVVKPNSAASMNYYEQALRSFEAGLSNSFAYDQENVTVSGDWGWSVFPGPVRTAIRKDMEDTALADANLLNQTIRAYRKFGMRDISQGNLRATFGFAPGLGDDVINLLGPYVWIGQVGYVV